MNEPKDGLYLDATLDAIGERVELTIDRMQRRRRRVGAGVVLGLLLAAGGSGAAFAAVLLVPDVAPAAVVAAPAQKFQCIAGHDAEQPAYFGMRFTATSDVSPTEAAAVCAAAWPDISTGVAMASVKDRAGELLRAELERADPAAQVQVESAYAGPIDGNFGDSVPPMAACSRTIDGAVFVITADAGERGATAAEWTRRCSLNTGFELAVAGVDNQ